MINPFDSSIYVAGGFDSYNGTPTNSIVKLDNNGYPDLNFRNNSSGTDRVIYDLDFENPTIAQPNIIFCGEFTNYNGNPTKKMARMKFNGIYDPGFSIGTGTLDNAGSGTNSNFIQTLKRQVDGKLIVGGNFTSFNGITAGNITRIIGDNGFQTKNSIVTYVSEPEIDINPQVNSVKIYPNPSGGFFNVDLSDEKLNYNKIVLYNILGVEVYVSAIIPREINQIDITNLPSGCYIGRISNESSSVQTKLIKKNFFYLFLQAYMKKLNFIFIVAFLVLGEEIVFSQPGTLDASYASNGRVITNYDPGLYVPDQSVIQQDGKVILMGGYRLGSSSIFEIGMSRHNQDGSIDTSFGTNGLVITDVNNHTQGNSIALQSDGKIIVAGYIENSGTSISLLVLRYNINGSLDISFGNNGIALFNNEMNGLSVKIQTDGKIVIGGRIANAFALARLKVDGNLDEDFGFNGLVTTTIIGNSYESQINAINIQNDGMIVASGFAYLSFTNVAFCTVRYDANGNIDTSFGTNGKVITDIDSSSSEYLSAQKIQQDGKIVLTGSLSYSAIIIRYLSNGNLDPTFGTNGLVTHTFGNSSQPYALFIQPDNKIVIAGNSPLPINNYFIARYTDVGVLDNNFNNTGYNMLAFGSSNNRFNSILMQQDGKLLVTGFTQIVNAAYTVIARFNSGLLNVNEFEKKEIKVYPNPSTGVFQLTFKESFSEKAVYLVYDLLGKMILEKEIPKDFTTCEINLENYPKGVYLLRIIVGDTVVNKKLIKG